MLSRHARAEEEWRLELSFQKMAHTTSGSADQTPEFTLQLLDSKFRQSPRYQSQGRAGQEERWNEMEFIC